MAFNKNGSAVVTGVLDKELDKTASLDDQKKKKEEFLKMDKPIQTASKSSEK